MYTFINRTEHRVHQGGYENWLIEYNNKKFYYKADIRIPGVVDDDAPLPNDIDKVCIPDFYSEESLNNGDIYLPTNIEGYSAKSIISSVIDLTLNVIKPIRKFKYVAIVCNKDSKNMYETIINKFGNPVSEKKIQDVIAILQPEIQLKIDMGIEFCLVGEPF